MTPTPEQNAKRVPTPRTDAQTFIAGHQDWEGECVAADFARTLETELQQLRLAADGMRERLNEIVDAFNAKQMSIPHFIGLESEPIFAALAAYRAAGEGVNQAE